MIDASWADAGAVLLSSFVALAGSGFVVRQAREQARTERGRREAAELQREAATQRKLDQEAFDRFEKANETRIKELLHELRSCKEITGAAVGYARALHDHMQVVHSELARNHIPVPAAPDVPDALSRYPWIPWKNGVSADDAKGTTA